MPKVKALGDQLTRYFEGDKDRVKQMASDCKAIGLPLGENVDAIAKNPEYFMLLVTYSDLGILGKLAEAIKKLKD